MSDPAAPELWLVRHGETEWSRDGRHTSTTDLPLTPVGEAAATALAPRLADVEFDLVLTSPRRRARRTAELAGFPTPWSTRTSPSGPTATTRASPPRRSARRCRAGRSGRIPSPGGESADEVSARLDRVVERVREHGRVLVFAHGHSLRVLTARWLCQPAEEGRFFRLDTATVSVLGFERETPVLLKWNS